VTRVYSTVKQRAARGDMLVVAATSVRKVLIDE